MLFLKLFSRGMIRALMVGGFGIGLAGVAIGISELWFLNTAVAVSAAVQDRDIQCSLRWEDEDEDGKNATFKSERMECAAAEALAQTKARRKIRVVEHHRSLLVYNAPDGRLIRKWSDLDRYEGKRLESGDTVPIMIDQDDPTEYRPVRGFADLKILAGMIFGGFAVGAGGDEDGNVWVVTLALPIRV